MLVVYYCAVDIRSASCFLAVRCVRHIFGGVTFGITFGYGDNLVGTAVRILGVL